MLLDMRAAKFGMADVPPIEYSEKVDIKGYETIVNVFTEALMKKMCQEIRSTQKELREYEWKQDVINRDRALFKDCIEQAVHFLKQLKALKKAEPINKIKLWRKSIQMEPFFEGVCAQLNTTLTKKHNSHVYEQMQKGAIWSSISLTKIKESITYTMEYFQKKKLYKDIEFILNTKFVKLWVYKTNKKPGENMCSGF